MNTNETYCFVSPFATGQTVDIITQAFAKVGKVKALDASRGYLKGKYRVSAFRYIDIEFYIERSETQCKVRALFHGNVISSGKDRWWDNFLSALFTEAPNADFGVSLAREAPYIVGVLYLGDDTHQVHSSRTTGGTSLLGFLAGGALFGVAGAVVGGMSGKQRTIEHSFEQFSSSQLARVVYNNGRLWEGTIKKGSDIYNEIMVNM